jgi:hypothetical protein
MEKKNATRINHKQVRKLTPEDLKKITGGRPMPVRDCTGPDQGTCLAYIVIRDVP